MRGRTLFAGATMLVTIGLAPGALATTIGVSVARFNDPFLIVVRNAMADEARAKHIDVQFEDAEDDTSKQISQIQNFIAQKVDALVVIPVDTSATPKMTHLATAAKIPLVYVNRKPEDKDLPPNVSFVGSNEKISGKLEGDALVKCMKGKGNLVIMEGQLSNNSSLDRTADIEEVVAHNPGIKIVEKQTANWDRNQALDLMNNWLTSGERIDGVASNNDEMAIGAILALRQAGRDPKSVCIGGIDAETDGLAEIRRGNLAVTVFQNAKGQGQGGIDTALKLTKGEKVAPYVDIPFEEVNSTNYKNYLNR